MRPQDEVVQIPAGLSRSSSSILRSLTASLGARCDLTIDEIEDLRIAVDEACALLLPHAAAGRALTATFSVEPGRLAGRRQRAGRSVRDAGPGRIRVDGSLGAGRRSDGGQRRRIAVGGDRQAASGPRPVTERSEAVRLLTELHQLPESSPRRRELRDHLVEMHMPLVEYLARRFSGRNEPLHDLVQVGAIGLIKSIDRFDPDRGLEFSTYATPTILGEIKRYFRDSGWLVHVPRRAQEMQTTLDDRPLRTEPGTGPRPDGRGTGQAHRAARGGDRRGSRRRSRLLRGAARRPDRETAAATRPTPLLAQLDEGFEQVEQRAMLRPAIEALPEREREILLLRFVAGKSQTEIADLVGVSQMQVSRLVTRSLAKLRIALTEPADDGQS